MSEQQSLFQVPDGYDSIKFLVEKYDVSISTIRRWKSQGKVSFVKHRSNGSIFYKEQDVACLAGEYVLTPASCK